MGNSLSHGRSRRRVHRASGTRFRESTEKLARADRMQDDSAAGLDERKKPETQARVLLPPSLALRASSSAFTAVGLLHLRAWRAFGLLLQRPAALGQLA